MKDSTANETTKAIITFLNLNGFFVWRNNTHGVYDVEKQVFRKLDYQKKGVSDIVGFRKEDAKFIAVEVKTKNDRVSDEQHHFLMNVKQHNGFAFIAYSFDDFLDKYQTRFQR